MKGFEPENKKNASLKQKFLTHWLCGLKLDMYIFINFGYCLTGTC